MVREQEVESGENTESTLWYAVYGSNLQRDRFMCYLRGGIAPNASPDAPVLPKCKGGTEIRDEKRFRLGFKLYFAYKNSRTWGEGGVAFVGIEPIGLTLGRAYLLTLPQLICVAQEENGGSHSVNITNKMLSGSPGTTYEITTDHKGRYRVLLLCGSINGTPVVTLTGWPKETNLRRSLPSKSYLKTIWQGLHETYPDISDSDIDEYLREGLRESCPSAPNSDIDEYIRSAYSCANGFDKTHQKKLL